MPGQNGRSAAGRIPLPNYTQVPNVVIDEYLPEVTPAEAKVLIVLCRATFGWHREWSDKGSDGNWSTSGAVILGLFVFFTRGQREYITN